MSSDKISANLVLIIIICLVLYSCSDNPGPDYDIYLSVEDVACVWVTLNVTLPDSGKINTFSLARNDSTVATYTCFDDDTMITDEGLTPDKDYSYTIHFLKNNQTKAESDPVSVHTLPTTSHDFIWEIDTLGHYGGYLKDAWIVDENNIWVVGNIETDSREYNAAHWNGSKWELLEIYSNTLDLNSIWYFSEDDIWVLASYPIHWDGAKWTHYHLTDMGIIPGGLSGDIWASNTNDIYFVGRDGRIVHYNGLTFQKIEGGTDVDLVDIWGIDENNIWTCGYTQTVGTVILRWNGKKWNQFHSLSYSDYINLNLNRISGPIVSIWTDSPNYLWAITYWGLYFISSTNAKEFIRYPDKNAWDGYILTIRGNNSRDILFSGHESAIWHYNGQELHYYSEINDNIIFYGMDYKDDLVCAVGTEYGTHRAIIVRGHHQ